MFSGQYSVRVGDFFRVAFPGPYKEKLGEKLIITFGFENSLIITSDQKWETLYSKEIEGKSFLLPEVRDIRRFFLGGITTLEFDKQARFIIPEYLREYANIKVKENVIFVWQEEYVEVWDKEKWNERQENILKNISTIAEKLSKNES